MAEITQKLGFDASQAISTLNNLQSALSGVNRQLRAMNAAVNQRPPAVIQGFAQTAAAAQQAQTSVQNAAGALQTAGTVGAKAGQSILLSWQSMLRIVQTQVLFKALGGLVQLFSSSAEAAGKFQIEVARISTIADGPGSSIDQLSASLKSLSAELGRPIAEVTAAAFEALQNDLGSTQQTMDFLGGAANKLALITGGTLTQSVNTLSSALKAGNLDISQASDLADIFFVTIDKGRVKLDDLESSLGTLLPLTTQLGINVAETSASFAAITQSGTNSATAITQLRNVVQKLIKPTKALDEVIHNLGFRSGKELIAAAGGLVPALRKLSDSVHGDEQALAKMFGTIRGQLGVFNLLSNDGKIVNETLQAMAERAGRAQKAFETVDNTDGQKIKKAVEALNNAMLDLGNSTIKVQLGFIKFATDAIGGFGAFTSTVEGLGSRVENLITQGRGDAPLLNFLARATSAVTLLSLGFASTIEEITGLNVGAGAGLQALIKTSTEALVQGRKQALETHKKEAAIIEADITANLVKESKSRLDVMGGYLKGVTALYQQEVGAFNVRSSELIAIQAGTVKSFEDSAKSIGSSIDDFFTNAQSRLQDRINETKSAFQELADFKFDRGLAGKSGRSQAFALDEEAARRTQAALASLAQADRTGSEEARKRALEEIKAAQAFNKRSEAAAKAASIDSKTTGAQDRQQNLLQAVADSAKKREDIERTAQENITKFDGESTKARLANVDALLKKQAELTDEKNRAGTTNTRRSQIEGELKDVSAQFADEFSKLTQDKLLQTLNLDKVFAKAALEAASALDKVSSEWSNARASLQAALSKEPFQAVANVVQQTVAPTGNKVVDNAVANTAANFAPGQNPADQAEKLRVTLENVKKEAQLSQAKFLQMANDLRTGNLQVAGLLGGLGNVDSTAKATVGSISSLSQTIGTAAADQLDSIKTNLAEISKQVTTQETAGKLSDEQATRLQTAIKTLFDSIEQRRTQLQTEGLFGAGVAEAADLALSQLSAKIGALDLGLPPEKVAAFFTPLTDQAAISSQELTTAFTGVANGMQTAFQTASSVAGTAIQGIQPIVDSISTANAISQMNALAAAAARALAAAQAAAAAGGGQNLQHGGPVYRAGGGAIPNTRGVDTRMVGMQPGEFVMNQKSSNRFFSQLQAMNAGQMPQFREHGGAVTNVGDINVSINGANPESISGRDIATSLRRELRRKTSKLL